MSKHGIWKSLVVITALSLFTCSPCIAAGADNVVLVLVDGVRWMDVFTGSQQELMTKNNGVSDMEAVKKEYWRDTPEARREALMPFLWKTVARQGQIFGNQNKGSTVRIANTFRFSYPGHSEMVVGFADPRINSNEKRPNPNLTVLEWLNRFPRFQGRVAAFSMWDATPAILNRDRCGFFVNSDFEPIREGTITPRMELLNELKKEIPPRWSEGVFDALLYHSAVEYLKANRPRVLYIAFGETDEWAHEGRYVDYLDSIRRTDRFIGTLWETMQAMPEYRDKTAMIIATDHGRGNGEEWKHHGEKIAGAEMVWIAALGVGVPPLGERVNTPELTLSQVAATLAALAGEDYVKAVPKAAAAIDLQKKMPATP